MRVTGSDGNASMWHKVYTGSDRMSLRLVQALALLHSVRSRGLKRPLIREDLKVIQYQSQEVDNTFIISDGTSPYNSMRKWAVKRHYREDNN